MAAAGERLSGYGARALVRQSGFEDLAGVVASPEVAAWLGPGGVPTRRVSRSVGVLFDLGVSSWQLDEPGRGFTYRVDAPLDMRMDRSQAMSARDVVNGYEEAELARVIARYGEERFARKIARAIVARRPVETTAALAEVVRSAIPAPARRTGPHPARRTFQAIRIEVNGELDHLAAGLDAAFSVLAPGGRLAVLSYHSLEDRIVKERFTSWTSRPPVPRGLPVTGIPGEPPPARLVTRGAARPTAAGDRRQPPGRERPAPSPGARREMADREDLDQEEEAPDPTAGPRRPPAAPAPPRARAGCGAAPARARPPTGRCGWRCSPPPSSRSGRSSAPPSSTCC